jgi:hypothetical protein
MGELHLEILTGGSSGNFPLKSTRGNPRWSIGKPLPHHRYPRGNIPKELSGQQHFAGVRNGNITPQKRISERICNRCKAEGLTEFLEAIARGSMKLRGRFRDGLSGD